jgi:hypothetical protein
MPPATGQSWSSPDTVGRRAAPLAGGLLEAAIAYCSPEEKARLPKAYYAEQARRRALRFAQPISAIGKVAGGGRRIEPRDFS